MKALLDDEEARKVVRWECQMVGGPYNGYVVPSGSSVRPDAYRCFPVTATQFGIEPPYRFDQPPDKLPEPTMVGRIEYRLECAFKDSSSGRYIAIYAYAHPSVTRLL